MFDHMKRSDEDGDFVLTFFQYLISRCIIRHAPGYSDYGIYAFSVPGRRLMSNDASRAALIGEFMGIYEYEPAGGS